MKLLWSLRCWSSRASIACPPKEKEHRRFSPGWGRLVEDADPATPCITPTHSVMDRLIAAVAWQDVQALEQAKLVTTHQADKIDWDEIDAWVIAEGIGDTPQVIDFYGEIRRASPPQ